jgi:mannose-1-phosphate guanylyltransferase
VRLAADKAQKPGSLVTIGIEPTHPETGYGYIQYDTAHRNPEQIAAHPVLTFAEKPDQSTAERFVDSGDFLWNSGMFVWRVEAIQRALGRYLPEVAQPFGPLAEGAATQNEEAVLAAYSACPSISIDYGVMERADDVWVVPGSFGWNDVGDWRAFAELQDADDTGNALQGDVLIQNSARCCVETDGRTVALVGVNDLIVVDTPDALLVCHRDAAQQVKNIVNYLSMHDRDDVI